MKNRLKYMSLWTLCVCVMFACWQMTLKVQFDSREVAAFYLLVVGVVANAFEFYRLSTLFDNERLKQHIDT
jgi:hypothetical protein